MTQTAQIKIGSYTYSEADCIGKGSFGKVYRGKSLVNGAFIAIKVINLAPDQSKQTVLLRMIKNEIEALKRVKHPNVVEFIDSIFTNGNVYIVTEFCNQKDLRFQLSKSKILDEKKALEWLKQIVLAFEELCKQQVMHRDLKPANVLLNNGICKIADFGFAKTLDFSVTDYNTHMVSIVGTPLYMSPQLLDKQKYTTKSDIWSLGIIYYEMLFGRVPWPAKDPMSYLKNMQTMPVIFDRTLNNISEESEDFIRKCLRVNEEQRIGWQEVFNHPLLKGERLKKNNMSEDSEDSMDESNSPEKHILAYHTRPANPSQLMKMYQDRILSVSKSLFQSQADLNRTTIDQKLRNMAQISMNHSGMKANLYAPMSRTFNMSFENSAGEGFTKSQNDNFLHTNRFKSGLGDSSRQASPSPDPNQLGQKVSKKYNSEIEREIIKIDSPLIALKTSITVLEELYEIINKSELYKDSPLIKFNFMLTIVKILNLSFKQLSSQILPKKIKIKSRYLEDYYESDSYKRLLVFCETNKKHYDDMLKKSSRRLFDLDFGNEREKDDVLDYYHEIIAQEDESVLLEKVVDLANQLSYNLSTTYVKSSAFEASTNLPNKEFFESVLALFGDDSLPDNYKKGKMDEVMSKLHKIKEDNRVKIQTSQA